MRLPFDKVYCIHLADDKERYENCLREFKRIGILDQVNFWWTCKRNISNFIGENINSLTDTEYWQNLINSKKISKAELSGNTFNCTFEHYTITKTAYQRGFEHILILEDDIRFVDNFKLIKDTFNNLPKDYDIIKFHDNESYDPSWYSNKPSDKQSFRRYNSFYTSTMCYALSKNGMIQYFTDMDRYFEASDRIDLSKTEFAKKLNVYGVKYRIILNGINRSRIQTTDITQTTDIKIKL